MNAIDWLLLALDHAWAHKWESVEAALAGVSPQEAKWQAACYAAEPTELGWPPPGTVLWHVLHLAHCKRHYTQCIQLRGQPERPTDPAFEPQATFEAARLALAQAHAELRAQVVALKSQDMELQVGHAMLLPEFLAMIQRHDTWHAAQIVLARRLFRAHGAPPQAGSKG